MCIHSLIHSAFAELPLRENHQSMGPGTVRDSEMNGMLQFLNELTLITADRKQQQNQVPSRARVEGHVLTGRGAGGLVVVEETYTVK